MNLDDMQFSFSAVQWLIMAAIGAYTWMVSRAAATNKEVVDLRERIVALEADIKNMPTEASVRELIGRLERLTAHHEGTQKSIETLQYGVNRINDFLLNQG